MAIIFNVDTGFYEKPFSKYSTESPGHILHPYYLSQTQNNPAQQSKHLQAPFCSSSASFLFSPDTNTTSSTYTCNESLSPGSIHPSSPSPGIINVDSPESSFHNSPAHVPGNSFT